MVVVEEIKNTAKNISKITDNDIINTAFNFVWGWAKAHIKNSLEIYTTTIPVFFNDKNFVFVSKRFLPLIKVEDLTNLKELTFDNSNGLIYGEYNKKINARLTIGEEEQNLFVQNFLSKLVAEYAIQIKNDLLGVDTKTNSFDVTNVTTKFNWIDVSEWDKIFERWYVRDYNRIEVGCDI